jgi:hypothetical protein
MISAEMLEVEWKTIEEDKLIKRLVTDYESILENWAEGDEYGMKKFNQYNGIKERDGVEKVEDDIEYEVKKTLYDKTNHLQTMKQK